ncbi:MAG: hypothetical protein AB7I41_13235 [Candidatus Sericytochromatia bacterium]
MTSAPNSPTPSFDSQSLDQLMMASQPALAKALELSAVGISSITHSLDEDVTFILDNQEEVVLRLKEIRIEYSENLVSDLMLYARCDFKNVLILAKKLNMKMGAFSSHFTVVLKGHPEFVETFNDQIIQMKEPADFFETLDEIKRPIFLNLNHYIIARISD